MVHGVGGGGMVGGFMGWVVGWWVVGGFMGWVGVVIWVVLGCMVGWLEGSLFGCIYSPTHEQLQCQNISFYEQPPTHQTYPKCHSVNIHMLWMVHGVGCGWWWGGWRVHRVGAYTHPPKNSYNVKIFDLMNKSNISKVSLCHCTYTLEGSCTRGWFMGGGGVHGGVSGSRVHVVGADTH